MTLLITLTVNPDKYPKTMRTRLRSEMEGVIDLGCLNQSIYTTNPEFISRSSSISGMERPITRYTNDRDNIFCRCLFGCGGYVHPTILGLITVASGFWEDRIVSEEGVMALAKITTSQHKSLFTCLFIFAYYLYKPPPAHMNSILEISLCLLSNLLYL